MALAAVPGALRVRRRRDRWLIALPVVVVLWTTTLFYGGHRIRSSAEPSLVLFSAVAVVAAAEAVRQRRAQLP
jgi:drug/metabolite transporter (DMT)-like permease